MGLGDNSIFTCTAYGGPPTGGIQLTFTWAGPAGIDVSNSVEMLNTTDNIVTSVLSLENISLSHEGNYNCSVAYSDMLNQTSTSNSAILFAILVLIQGKCYKPSGALYCLKTIIILFATLYRST